MEYGRINRIIENFRVERSAKHFIDEYFCYGGVNSSPYHLNTVQRKIIHSVDSMDKNNREINIIAGRQAGSTSVLLAHTFWDTFVKPTSGNVTIFASGTMLQAKDNKNKLLRLMDISSQNIQNTLRRNLFENITSTEYSICDDNRNSIIFCSTHSLVNTMRGKHITKVCIDNAWSYGIEYYDTIKTARHADYIIQMQSGLMGDTPSNIEHQSNTIYLPNSLNANYTLSFEEEYINRLGYDKYAQYYLLTRN